MSHSFRHFIGPVSLTLLFRRHLIIRHDANDDNDRCLSVECLADMSIPDDPIKDLLQLVTCTAGVAPSPSDALFSFIVLLRSSVGVSPSPSPHRACLSYSCSPSSNHSTTTTTITTRTTQLRTCHQPCEPDRACACRVQRSYGCGWEGGLGQSPVPACAVACLESLAVIPLE